MLYKGVLMRELIIQSHWELFILMEIIASVSLILFLLVRYVFRRQSLSMSFLILFLVLMAFEAGLGYMVYRQTGELNTFQMIIGLFLLYACTFGIADFKKLDRYIKQKIGKWQGVDLLTEKDRRIMREEKDPLIRARKYRRWWYGHALVFIIVNYLFWHFFGKHDYPLSYFLTDWSWIEKVGQGSQYGPFRIEGITQATLIWGIVFIVDTINAWYYTFFPEKEKTKSNGL